MLCLAMESSSFAGDGGLDTAAATGLGQCGWTIRRLARDDVETDPAQTVG